jgi:putative tricarboxylic transport membrane protein
MYGRVDKGQKGGLIVKSVKIYCSLFWFLFAVVMGQQSFRLPMGVMRDPGAGFFPLLVAFLTGLLAILALIDTLREKQEPTPAQEESSGPTERFRWWNLVVICAALIAYGLTLPTVGFLISTFWFMLLLLKVIDPQSWTKSLVASAITAVASELFFNVLLSAQIPTGILGF